MKTGDDFTENRFGPGYSVRVYVVRDRFVLGAAAESYNNFIFKIGYTLQRSFRHRRRRELITVLLRFGPVRR